MLVCVDTKQLVFICQVQGEFHMTRLAEERQQLGRKKNKMHNLLDWKFTVQLPSDFL